VPQGMSRLELYEGYRRLLRRLYAYRNYRRRSMAFLLNKGALLQSRLLTDRADVGLFLRIVWSCLLRTSPPRAWFTLSMLAETALRRPSAFRDAVILALMHKHLYEYMRDTSKHLERMIRDLKAAAPRSIPST
jgi:predicted nucleic acid-binding protein